MNNEFWFLYPLLPLYLVIISVSPLQIQLLNAYIYEPYIDIGDVYYSHHILYSINLAESISAASCGGFKSGLNVVESSCWHHGREDMARRASSLL